MRQVDVGPDVRRILAAQLEPQRRERSRCRLLDAAPAFDQTSEVDVVDPAGSDQLLGVGVIENEILEQPVRQTRRHHRLGKTLARQQRLRCLLEDDRVTGHESRDDRG